MLAEREREWSGLQSELREQLERVRAELGETQTQCQLLRETSEKVSNNTNN